MSAQLPYPPPDIRPLSTRVRHAAEDAMTLWRKRRDLTRYGMAYYGFWDIGPVPDSWFYRFLQRPALAAHAARRRVAFHSIHARLPLVERNPWADLHVFYTQEYLTGVHPRWIDYGLSPARRRTVDLTMGFVDLPDERYLRFPVWLLYAFDPGSTRADIERRLAEYAAASQDLPTRPAFATLVARHDRSGLRAALGDVAAQVGPVSYPGAFRRNTPRPLGSGVEDKLAWLRQHRFNLCPENAAHPGYVTEKLFQALEAGCIPVYWGTENSPEFDWLNPEAFLRYDPQNPAELTARLASLENNPAELSARAGLNPFLPDAAEAVFTFFLAMETQFLGLLR